MPLLVSYDFTGIPGIIVAAPTMQYFDVAYSEQTIKEQWKIVLQREPESVTFPWSYEVAARMQVRPWWTQAF